MTTASVPSGRPFVVVSDLHLGAVPPATERRFLEFLQQEASEASGLLINGDLFDFGMAYRSVVRREHVRVLAELAKLVESGVPVYFLGGNHDYVEWGGHVLAEDAGVQLLPDPVVMDIAGRRALVTHGDTAGEGATRERIERRLARNRFVVAFMRWIHPDLADRLHPYMTGTRRQVRRHAAGQGGGPKRRAPGIEAWARATLRDDPSLDIVIAGHAHLPALVEVDRGRYYLNAGDWITHDSYLVLPDGGPPEVRYWPRGDPSAPHP